MRITKLKSEISDCRLDADLVSRLIAWRDKRLATVSGASVRREMALLSSVFTYAKREWRINVSNPITNVTRPEGNLPRTRRVSDEELASIVGEWTRNGDYRTQKEYINPLAWFAVETGMRLGEILALEWTDVKEKWVHIRMSKNGHGRVVPLSPRAQEIIHTLPKAERPFPLQAATVDVYWRKIRPDGLHFHDLRREAISRMAKVVPVNVLAKISGHQDLKILNKVYYAPTPEDLASYFTHASPDKPTPASRP